MRQVRPLHDYVLVKRAEGESTSKGGIIIPDQAKEKPAEGVVMAVGSGTFLENGTRRALDLNVGDRILYSKFAGAEVKVDNETLLVVREYDVFAVLLDDASTAAAT